MPSSNSFPIRNTFPPNPAPHPHPPVPEAHHSSLSHTVTFDRRGRDYGDQINYDLIPKQRCRHYSKSRSAKALMTIDCPNIACVLAATGAAAPTVPASVSGDRKWIVLHLFIDIAFHLRWPGRYSSRKMPWRWCFINFSLPLSSPSSYLFLHHVAIFVFVEPVHAQNFIKFFTRLHKHRHGHVGLLVIVFL